MNFQLFHGGTVFANFTEYFEIWSKNMSQISCIQLSDSWILPNCQSSKSNKTYMKQKKQWCDYDMIVKDRGCKLTSRKFQSNLRTNFDWLWCFRNQMVAKPCLLNIYGLEYCFMISHCMCLKLCINKNGKVNFTQAQFFLRLQNQSGISS